MTIEELKAFCGDTFSRTQEPWSHEGFTFATNGHIMVRVPQMVEVTEGEPIKGMMARILPYGTPSEWYPLSGIAVPPAQEQECESCEGGRETVHDCPECTCVCDECDGTGRILDAKGRDPIIVGCAGFQTKYLRMLSTLPGCEIGPISEFAIAPFRFDGGDGVLMPMRIMGGIPGQP